MKDQYDLFEGTSEARRIIHEYLGVISTPLPITNLVIDQKEKADSMIGPHSVSRYSKPHLTLTHFSLRTDLENHVMERASRILANERPVLIKINGIGFFESGSKRHVVNHIEKSKPIERIYDLLNKNFPFSSNKKFNPHITVAKSLSPFEFQKVQPYLPEFNFVASYTAYDVVILRREIEFLRNQTVVTNYVPIYSVPLK